MSTSTASSPEYRAALFAQLDYDSTLEGLEKLTDALSGTSDEGARRSIRARLVSGRAARRFRQEQLKLMPPEPRRTEPFFRTHRHLAQKREDLARALGLATAESDAWGRPTPGTSRGLLDCSTAVLTAEQAMGPHLLLAHHPAALREDHGLVAPWCREAQPMLVGPDDVGVLWTLGVESVWDGSGVIRVVGGDPDAAARWGYGLEPAAESPIVTKAPAIIDWFENRESLR